jgi:hypothetical protein
LPVSHRQLPRKTACWDLKSKQHCASDRNCNPQARAGNAIGTGTLQVDLNIPTVATFLEAAILHPNVSLFP